MTETKTKDLLFRVNKGRALHLNRKGVPRPEIWAKEGQIVRINHPMLWEFIKGQEHKLTELKGVPDGEQVQESVPAMLTAQLVQYDRMQAKGDSESKFPAVSRPTTELEKELKASHEKNATLAKKIEELTKRLDSKESGKYQRKDK